MTTINTDYNKNEHLDQELTTTELSEVSGVGAWEQIQADRRALEKLLSEKAKLARSMSRVEEQMRELVEEIAWRVQGKQMRDATNVSLTTPA